MFHFYTERCMRRLPKFSATFAIVILANAWSFSQSTVRFACVGDYGREAAVQSVANLVAGWNPDFVITVGDNNYTANNASVASWDNEVGRYYGQFIHYPSGSASAYAPGPASNKFFPALGNHDWDALISGWYDYFELPGNERYYSVVKGPVTFFFIDSDAREPDGITSSSTQGQWLQNGLVASTSPWKIVCLHHPPYSSGTTHGNTPNLQWPFATWGASLVLAGHEHNYERVVKNGFNHIVNGLGGRPLYSFKSTPEPGSVVRYNSNYGAMLITATANELTLKLYSLTNTLVDSISLVATSTHTPDKMRTPSRFHLEQNFPNPFNPSTTIGYTLERRTHATLRIHNMLGQVVATLVNRVEDGGKHLVQFNTSTLASGSYFYRLEADGLSETKQLVVLK